LPRSAACARVALGAPVRSLHARARSQVQVGVPVVFVLVGGHAGTRLVQADGSKPARGPATLPRIDRTRRRGIEVRPTPRPEVPAADERLARSVSLWNITPAVSVLHRVLFDLREAAGQWPKGWRKVETGIALARPREGEFSSAADSKPVALARATESSSVSFGCHGDDCRRRANVLEARSRRECAAHLSSKW